MTWEHIDFYENIVKTLNLTQNITYLEILLGSGLLIIKKDEKIIEFLRQIIRNFHLIFYMKTLLVQILLALQILDKIFPKITQ